MAAPGRHRLVGTEEPHAASVVVSVVGSARGDLCVYDAVVLKAGATQGNWQQSEKVRKRTFKLPTGFKLDADTVLFSSTIIKRLLAPTDYRQWYFFRVLSDGGLTHVVNFYFLLFLNSVSTRLWPCVQLVSHNCVSW